MDNHPIHGFRQPESRLRQPQSALRSLWLDANLAGALAFLSISLLASPGADLYRRQAGWVETMLATRQSLAAANLSAQAKIDASAEAWARAKDDFPIQCDWILQDAGRDFETRWWNSAANDTSLEQHLVQAPLKQLGAAGHELGQETQRLVQSRAPGSDPRWLYLYVKACEARRRQRLQIVLAQAPRIVFVKHRTLRPSFFAYTEGQSDAQNERHFIPGAQLCVLEFDGLYGRTKVLVDAPTGAIRDPAVSWDGSRILFAWKKSLDEDDYHLYELNAATNSVRQVTSGLGFADYEPVYLPNDDIIFASTRCVQTVDCWWTEVSNLYTCDRNGRYLRRLGFDQVHAIFPQLMDDGRVIYTRWDYNDRGQIFPQPLFQMFQDGTGQTEFYGNNSWFPTTIAHARGIPGTDKALAILCGHHSSQAGKLAVIDPARGRQENQGVQLVAPVRETPAERIDGYGQDGELWQYPYPLNDAECLVAYAPLGWESQGPFQGDAAFGIYWMDFDGRRELLVSDPLIPCTQPVPLAPRRKPLGWANRLDYTQTTGTYYVQDIYAGPGLAGVARGTVQKLRVVALQYRAAGIGNNGSSGPGGGALICTPVSIGNGTWDVKVVLGDAKVYEDGSALFTVPARTPVYFQAIDNHGRALQTMRSWSTLQPGESAACVGCHEHKNTAPPTADYTFSLAMKAGTQKLTPFYGPPRGFSFPKEIQPILDRHCIRCHNDRSPVLDLVAGRRTQPVLSQDRSTRLPAGSTNQTLAFSLLAETSVDSTAKRKWSDAYLVLTRAQPDQGGEAAGAFHGDCGGRIVNWISSQSVPEPLRPRFAGAVRSELLPLLEQGHAGVHLSREELDKIACWIDLLVPYCGDYLEANAWTEAEMKKYERFAEKRRQMEEIEQENIRDLLGGRTPARGRGPGGPMGPFRPPRS